MQVLTRMCEQQCAKVCRGSCTVFCVCANDCGIVSLTIKWFGFQKYFLYVYCMCRSRISTAKHAMRPGQLGSL